MEGKRFIDFVKKEDIKRFIHVFKLIRDQKQRIVDFYGSILHKDGTERLFHMSGAPNIDSDGNVTGAVGTFRDITELKKSELELWDSNRRLWQEIEERKLAEAKKAELESQLQHAQKMEAIGTLAGGIAHDFNNLLMGIQGHASLMLLDTEASHHHYDRLKNIEHYVVRGADLTRQLLGFARGGKYEIKPTDINELIIKSSRMFGRTKKELALTTRLEPNIWTVEIDQGQIEQVLLNLYLNAAQAMPGGGRIDIETQNRNLDKTEAQKVFFKPGKYVTISVKDTGIGMDEKTKQRIFEPFFTTREMGRGTGLGLASAYGIVKSHGGFIDVESKIGYGSDFIIHLPVSAKAPQKERAIHEEKLYKGDETILLVDDEAVMLKVVTEMLNKLNYKVILAKSGKEAIELFMEKKDEIHLTILDMIMPEMNGTETFNLLNQIQPGLKVLVSSGYSLSEEAVRISKLGCNSFIQKPYDIYRFSSKIREVLEKTR
ncbi:MAG: response regulator [Deltaproteobacteria bacterium]|nr:response regulator [Deltaproteobacteria bacterium]